MTSVHPSGCGRCGAGAGCSSIKHQNLCPSRASDRPASGPTRTTRWTTTFHQKSTNLDELNFKALWFKFGHVTPQNWRERNLRSPSSGVSACGASWHRPSSGAHEDSADVGAIGPYGGTYELPLRNPSSGERSIQGYLAHKKSPPRRTLQ